MSGAKVTVNEDGSGTIQWSEAGEDHFDSVAADAVNLLVGSGGRQGDLVGKEFEVDTEDEERLYVAGKTLYLL